MLFACLTTFYSGSGLYCFYIIGTFCLVLIVTFLFRSFCLCSTVGQLDVVGLRFVMIPHVHSLFDERLYATLCNTYAHSLGCFV